MAILDASMSEEIVYIFERNISFYVAHWLENGFFGPILLSEAHLLSNGIYDPPGIDFFYFSHNKKKLWTHSAWSDNSLTSSFLFVFKSPLLFIKD